MRLTHLQQLEAESIQIMREAVAQADRPALLYSMGKDSSVLLRLAVKAFYPSRLPFPLVHVDTLWKFQAMYKFRDAMAEEHGAELIVHHNPDCIEQNINKSTTVRQYTPTCGKPRDSNRSSTNANST